MPSRRSPCLERGSLATWTPQEARFEFGFTVRAVVAQGRFAHGDDGRGVDEAIARFDLAALAHRPVNQLSGGERHRVLLARALTTAAPLQLWDEPLAALMCATSWRLLKLAVELTRAGTTMMLSLHDLRIAHCLDEVIVLHDCCVRASGQPDAVLTAGNCCASACAPTPPRGS